MAFPCPICINQYHDPPATASEDEAAIREVIVEMTDSFNKHDPVAATRMYSADADFTQCRGHASERGSGN
jgi:hypothetical protein